MSVDRFVYAAGVGILAGMGSNVAEAVDVLPDVGGTIPHMLVGLAVGLITYSRGEGQ